MEEIAEVYARALFEVAKQHDVLDRVHDELGEFAEALAENRTSRCSCSRPTSRPRRSATAL